MAKRSDLNTSGPEPGEAPGSTTDSKEQRLVAFAEQLGWIVGTVQRKAEGWLNSEALTAQISKVRDSASACWTSFARRRRPGLQRAPAPDNTGRSRETRRSKRERSRQGAGKCQGLVEGQGRVESQGVGDERSD